MWFEEQKFAEEREAGLSWPPSTSSPWPTRRFETWVKVRLRGYLFIWWTGDHTPRHVHVFDSKERLLGRVAIETKAPLDDWIPTKKAVEIIADLQRERRL